MMGLSVGQLAPGGVLGSHVSRKGHGVSQKSWRATRHSASQRSTSGLRHTKPYVTCHGWKSQDANTKFVSRVQRMTEKYDFLSAFIGSCMVTGYFVSFHGQDVGTALGITSMATVVAVLVEEFIFNSSSSS